MRNSTANNIIDPHTLSKVLGPSVWKDPARRFGGLYVTQARDGNPEPKLRFSVSDDGKVWRPAGFWNCGSTECDTESVAFWDRWRGEYALYTRDWVNTQTAGQSKHYRTIRRLSLPKNSSFFSSSATPGSQPDIPWGGSVQVMVPDPLDWTYPALSPGYTNTGQKRQPAVGYYGGSVWPVEHSATPLYMMLVHRLWHWIPQSMGRGADAGPGMLGPAMIDTGLAYSRDGANFTHIGGRESFFHGQTGSFDAKIQWLAVPVPSADGTELLYYYAGSNQDHKNYIDGDGPLREGIGLAIGRMDGFSALVAPLHSARGGDGDGSQSQWLVTKPVAVSGTELLLNLDTGAQGVVLVEILAGHDRGWNGSLSVPGFGFANTVPIIADK